MLDSSEKDDIKHKLPWRRSSRGAVRTLIKRHFNRGQAMNFRHPKMRSVVVALQPPAPMPTYQSAYTTTTKNASNHTHLNCSTVQLEFDQTEQTTAA